MNDCTAILLSGLFVVCACAKSRSSEPTDKLGRYLIELDSSRIESFTRSADRYLGIEKLKKMCAGSRIFSTPAVETPTLDEYLGWLHLMEVPEDVLEEVRRRAEWSTSPIDGWEALEVCDSEFLAELVIPASTMSKLEKLMSESHVYVSSENMPNE